jgi:hypothetical protein
MYQGINENLASGYIQEVQAEVIKDQERLVGLDELSMFMEAFKIAPGTKEIPAIRVYQIYSTWAEANGIKNPLNSIWFGRKLTNKHIENMIKTVRGKTTRIYLVADDCQLLKEGYDPLASDLDKWN